MSSSVSGSRVIHLYPSTILHESRMLRTAELSASPQSINEVHLVGLWRPGLSEREQVSDKISIIRIKTYQFYWLPGVLRKLSIMAGWWFSVWRHYRKNGLRSVSAHSLSALPIAAFLARKDGCFLVYEPHELETESIGSWGVRRQLSQVLERILIGRASLVVVVGEYIADWYKKQYAITDVMVIRNLPDTQMPGVRSLEENLEVESLRTKFHIEDDALLFLYQGVLGRGRFIRQIVDAFSQTQDGAHVVFLGYGPLEEYIRGAASRYGNIHFYRAVSPVVLKEYTRQADIGLCIIENLCLSYYYSLPNKLFEYLTNGVPVLASNFPEMGKVINEVNGGYLIEPQEAEIVRKIATLDRSNLVQVDINKVMKNHSWTKESCRLRDWYIYAIDGHRDV